MKRWTLDETIQFCIASLIAVLLLTLVVLIVYAQPLVGVFIVVGAFTFFVLPILVMKLQHAYVAYKEKK